MRVRVLAVLALAALLSGCLRLGPGADLHLVCEERSASPRKAYDIGFLVAQTRVEGTLDDKTRVAVLEAARHHVITPGGRPHFDFQARLVPAEPPGAWRFTAVGGAGERADVYEVIAWREGATWVAGAEHGAPGLIRPPASVTRPAWEAANVSSEVSEARPAQSEAMWATWSAALPSCVRLTYANAEGERLDVVVNVVQSRVVHLESPSARVADDA